MLPTGPAHAPIRRGSQTVALVKYERRGIGRVLECPFSKSGGSSGLSSGTGPGVRRNARHETPQPIQQKRPWPGRCIEGQRPAAVRQHMPFYYRPGLHFGLGSAVTTMFKSYDAKPSVVKRPSFTAMLYAAPHTRSIAIRQGVYDACHLSCRRRASRHPYDLGRHRSNERNSKKE